jgi:hypothetical protein
VVATFNKRVFNRKITQLSRSEFCHRIEEQISTILESAPTIEDHLLPHHAQIAKLKRELDEAKTNPKRQAIRRKLKRTLW